MPFHLRPTRREPRPLLIAVTRRSIVYACLDPWELRALGEIHERRHAPLLLALGRVLLQAKPTTILRVTPLGLRGPRALDAVLDELAVSRRLTTLRLAPVMVDALRAGAPSTSELAEQYPALRHGFAPAALDAARLAARSLTHLALPSRFYAPRIPLRAKAPLGAAGARAHRNA